MTGLLCSAAIKEPVHLESTAEDDDDLPVSRWSTPRELMILAASLLFGIFLAPLLIWAAGHLSLGSYAHGGAFVLVADYLKGLVHGSPIFWAVALGPYVMVLLLRFLASQLRPRS
jgi:hypothetical protein